MEKGATVTLKNKTCRYLSLIGKNVVDIFRTPAYGIALLIMGIGAGIIGPLTPKAFLFKMRETIGKVELSLNKGDKSSVWIVYPCFQPLKNIDKLKTWGEGWKLENVQYPEEINNTEKGLLNLAALQIDFKRKHRAIFNDCFRLLPDNASYVSASAQK